MKYLQTIKYAFAVFLCLAITGTVLAHGNNLWQHYNTELPSISERALIYIGDDEYTGTEEQNVSLHAYIDDYLDNSILTFGALAFPPSTVEGTSTAGWTDDGSIVRLNTASDFVGIGTTNPAEKLTVTSGNFRLEGDISLITGSIAYVVGDISLGGGDLNIGTGSATTTLTVDSSGNLGVGSTTPADTLSVQGTLRVSGTSTQEGIIVEGPILRINNVAYSYPSYEIGSSTVLASDGNGNLTPFVLASEVDTMVLLLSTTTEQAMPFATTSIFASLTELRVVIDSRGLSSAASFEMYFNSDRTASYGWKVNEDGIFGESSSLTRIRLLGQADATSSPALIVIDINNQSSFRKFVSWKATVQDSGSRAPQIVEGGAVWDDTSAQITNIVFTTGSPSSVNITSGTRIRVYGN